MRGATLFSGGGGVEALLKDRITFCHAVEYDARIADVYRCNIGDHITVADVCDVDYTAWGQLDYLHASPVCKNASQAKTDGAESDTDIQTALAVVRCMEATRPDVFTLENVWGYRTFQAFRLICQALDRGGYMWHYAHLNAADFGVPQTRRRLILRASRGLLPTLPEPEPWVGWYAAIEDLIPTLPESKFADWQLARLPAQIAGAGLLMQSRTEAQSHDKQYRTDVEPFFTVDVNGCKPKAIIVSNSKTEFSDGIRDGDEPMLSVTTQTMPRARAWLVESKNANQQYGDGMRADNEPATTVVTDHKESHRPKAWLVEGSGNQWSALGANVTVRAQDEPSYTIRSGSNNERAWLTAGRVVKMTPRALARFQSLPDWYDLPEKAALACTVIGNMVPSLMMRKIVEQLIGGA